MRLLILTQYFPPEIGAPQARLSELALLLRERGVDVQVLTAMPSYPTGRVFGGWRGRWFMRDEWRGLPVVRAFAYPTQSPRAMPRLLNYFSFVLGSLIAGTFMTGRCDVILVESPPLFLGLAGMALKRVKRAKLVFNVSDLWPETAVALGLYDRQSSLVRLAGWLERVLYRSSDAVTGQSPGIVKGITERHPAARVSLVPNGVDGQLFSPDKRDRSILSRFGCEDKVVVGYAGLIGIAQGIRMLIDVARRLEHRPEITFLIVGDGPERAELQRAAGTNVVFAGLLPKAEMPALVATFEMTIIALKLPIPGALPSKMYEAMACEVPIVLAAEGDPRALLENAGCGLHAAYDDPDAVAGAVLALFNDRPRARELGRAGRAYVLAHHRREVIAEGLLTTLEAVAAGAAR